MVNDKIPDVHHAEVRFSIQVEVSAHYGPDWKLMDMHAQIIDEIKHNIAKALSEAGIKCLTAIPVSISTVTVVSHRGPV